jgi:hypothetical protein
MFGTDTRAGKNSGLKFKELPTRRLIVAKSVQGPLDHCTRALASTASPSDGSWVLTRIDCHLTSPTMSAPGVQPPLKSARTTQTTPIRRGRGPAGHGDSMTPDPPASSQSTTPSVTGRAHPLVIANNLRNLPPDPARRDPARPWFMFDYEDPSPKFKVMPPDFVWKEDLEYIDAPPHDRKLVDEGDERTVAVSARGYQSVHHTYFT